MSGKKKGGSMSYAHIRKIEESGIDVKFFIPSPNIDPKVISLLLKLFWSKFLVVLSFSLQ